MALPFPVIAFQVNLTPPKTVAFGPKTNQTLQGTDSPDNIVDAPNQTYINALKAQRPHDISTMMPAVANLISNGLLAPSIVPPTPNKMKHGDWFVVAGKAALDTMKLYCNQATIQTYLAGFTGPGAAPSFDILSVLYFGPDPGVFPVP